MLREKPVRSAGLTLLFDADDTLWENNIYFERAIASFISFLDHKRHTAEEVREHLNQVEHDTIARHGYGTVSFRRSLVRCFEELCQAPPDTQQHDRIMSFVDAIVTQEIEVMEGVHDALHTLVERHTLLLVTKGDPVEQRQKLVESGLAGCFRSVEVLREKTAEAYREIVLRYGLDASRTWMVGNSPRSDINPALAAGLHAVFVPHPSTWVLEHEPVQEPPPGQRLLVLERLQDLARELPDKEFCEPHGLGVSDEVR